MARCLLVLACFVATIAAAVESSDLASVVIKTGRAGPHGPNQLSARDGKVVAIASEKVAQSQILECTLRVPTPELPEEIASASVALAISSNAVRPLKASIWLPDSRIWQQLETEYLTTDAQAFISLDLPRPKQMLAGKRVELILRVEDHAIDANPISLRLDAVKVIVQAKRELAEDAHAAAVNAGAEGPVIRVHQFAGESSNNFESQRRQIAQKFHEPPQKSKPKKKKKKKRR